MKGIVIFFLSIAFFIPASTYAGNKAFDNKQASTVSSYTQAHFYTKMIQDHEPAISMTNQFYACTTFNLYAGTQKIFNFQECYYCGINYFLFRLISTTGVNGFLPKKKYLFYIYPSHDFW